METAIFIAKLWFILRIVEMIFVAIIVVAVFGLVAFSTIRSTITKNKHEEK